LVLTGQIACYYLTGCRSDSHRDNKKAMQLAGLPVLTGMTLNDLEIQKYGVLEKKISRLSGCCDAHFEE